MTAASTFFGRHEFLIRRLHSLSGLVPVGAYMTVHLIVNASLLDGPGTFQRNVNQIHSLGAVLPLVEWGFIFLPILFHAILGVVFLMNAKSNVARYPLGGNVRYVLQRVTGMIAFAFIVYHVFHLHGWFHFEWWKTAVAEPLGGHQFRPYNAASTLAEAFQPWWVPPIYAVGVLACVYHLANGLWTFGITWGLWVTPVAQRRANYVALGFGVLLAAAGLGSLFAGRTTDPKVAREAEDKIYTKLVESGLLEPTPEKRAEEGREESPSADADPADDASTAEASTADAR